MLKLLYLLLFTFSACSSESILFFNGFATHSHLVAMEPLANKLADRGYAVTIVTPMKPSAKHPNITYYCPQEVLALQEHLDDVGTVAIQARIESKYNDYILQSGFLLEGHFEICRKYYTSQGFKEWIKNSKFDLVIIDALAKECALPLAHIFKAKSIIFSPHTLLNFDADTYGWPVDASGTLPIEEHPFLPNSFQNEKQSLLWYFMKVHVLLPKYDSFFRDEIKLEGVPSLLELESNTALMFLNVHFSYEFARSLPPSVIPIGGIHCRESKGLEDGVIKREVEDGQFKGFVLVSFGSYARISAAPEEFLRIFFKVFAQFTELKFLWKWEGETPENVPENIFMHKWFPQQDILAHPRCKGFITHGGLMSLQQSIFHAVPVIAVPLFGDQPINARMSSAIGNGINIEPSELTQEILKGAIQELVFTDKYSSKAKEVSKQFKDRPMPPVNTAVWWTEYVLRTDNLDRLKPLSRGQYWWERRMLHFWGLIFLLSLTFCVLVFAVITLILRRIFSVPKRPSSSHVAIKQKKQGHKKKL